MKVELPWPPAILNPNRKNGTHWAKSQPAKAKYHADAIWACRAAKASFAAVAGDIPLSVTFVQPDKRRRDRDNLLASIKTGLDAVARELGIDDSQFNPVIVRREYGGKPGVVVVEIGNQGDFNG